MIGKWDIGAASWNMTPTYRGFDTFFGFYGAALDYYSHTEIAKKNSPVHGPRHHEYRRDADANMEPESAALVRNARQTDEEKPDLEQRQLDRQTLLNRLHKNDEVHKKVHEKPTHPPRPTRPVPVKHTRPPRPTRPVRVIPTERPCTWEGVDFRNGTALVDNMAGVYSTNIYTDETIRHINSYKDGDAPLFIYLSHQAVHAPMQAPQKFLKSAVCQKAHTPVDLTNRYLKCGLVMSLDESTKNVTDALKQRGLYDNTLIFFLSDNGGNVRSGSSNLPLRGNKSTYFEGGIRVISFVSGGYVPHALRGTVSDTLMHAVDLLPTLAGVAGIDIRDLKFDGVNQGPAIFENKPSARDEILLQLDPPNPDTQYIGVAAIRHKQWKLIVGQVNCTEDPKGWQRPYVPNYDSCPSGWVMINTTMIHPPPQPSLVWLFDIIADPYEKNDLSEQHPSIVKLLKERIELYRTSVEIPQQDPRISDGACPDYFNPPGWWPWL
jgi:arylsulfatase A-like enzyme